ncbi:MBL fold metallo-hydrolase [Nocardioides anomalus]|uniref:MBL fold metallo-hydrolase n=1 Tax=Nocardioides anomalus TaxID=2712223 RepID=A0A6G6WKC2_9ACTN|nr:MBL fold metallo-hydrolase [Nocardioides anomalus]QIG45607.1 MBL fold metallo-hydrolase [Nocardioides anomalus]
MRITKFGHACVRIEHEGQVVVLDPGVFTEPEAVDGATAVLVTHLHPDHLHPDNLRATDAPVFTVGQVHDQLREDAPDVAERTTTVAVGAAFDVGLPVRAVGELHNIIHPELPQPYNSGYLVTVGDQTVYHPGDALALPEVPVDLLLCPASAPWLRSEMAVEFVRGVGAPRNLAIHDRIYSETGHQFLAMQMEQLAGPRGLEWVRRGDGEDL